MSSVLKKTAPTADYGVPHCKFTRNDDGGFTVAIRREPVFSIVAAIITSIMLGFLLLAEIATGIWLGLISTVIAALCIGLLSYNRLFPLLAITVNPDFVIINDVQLPRRDFGHFAIVEGGLGYQFENRTISCGVLMTSKLTDVASALNEYLRKTPLRGDESRISADALRNSRPTDF